MLFDLIMKEYIQVLFYFYYNKSLVVEYEHYLLV
jgi:hypothetical protein